MGLLLLLSSIMTDNNSTTSSTTERPHADHLESLEDGAGCTEIWEKLSESREES